MPDSPIQFTQITLAAIRIREMVKFYNTLFGSRLEPVQSHGTTFYHGTLAGIPLVICPNEIAGVDAKQARHQLSLRVADLLGLLQLVEIAGGNVSASAGELVVSAILRDPDGNTIEVVQA